MILNQENLPSGKDKRIFLSDSKFLGREKCVQVLFLQEDVSLKNKTSLDETTVSYLYSGIAQKHVKTCQVSQEITRFSRKTQLKQTWWQAITPPRHVLRIHLIAAVSQLVKKIYFPFVVTIFLISLIQLDRAGFLRFCITNEIIIHFS